MMGSVELVEEGVVNDADDGFFIDEETDGDLGREGEFNQFWCVD